MGRKADAEETYKKAVALRPDYWDGYNSLGNFYTAEGRYAEGIEQLEHAAETDSRQSRRYIISPSRI